MGFITSTVARRIEETKSLRATPPPNTVAPGAAYSPNQRLASLSVRSASLSHLMDAAGASVAPTGNNYAPVGAEGSDGNAGQIAGAQGNVSYGLGMFTAWQAQNPGLGMIARIGLPVAGVLLWTKGHHTLGGVAILASVPLWYSKFKG